MAAPTLIANPDIIIVDSDSGQTSGTTHISYDDGGGTFGSLDIWARIFGKPWGQLKLFKLVGTPDADRKGDFETNGAPFAPGPVAAGEVLEVRMYQGSQHANPNLDAVNDRPLKTLTILSLLKKPHTQDLFQDSSDDTGGTYHGLTVVTKVPTFFAVQVSRTKPFTDANGMLRFATLDGSAPKFVDFGTLHKTDVIPAPPADKLWPGTHYYRLLLLTDDKGNWQYVPAEFTTKQRKVTVNFTNLHIIDDGDDDTIFTGIENGEASFVFGVKEGAVTVREFTYGTKFSRVSISDEKPGWDIALAFTHLLGPKPISESNDLVTVEVNGTEYDWPGTDEHARSGFKGRLFFKSGRGQETMTNVVQEVHAGPDSGDSLNLLARVEYSVEYS